MVCCCIPRCGTRKGRDIGVSFHEFPSNLKVREKWLNAIPRKNFIPNDRSATSVVCSLHFLESDYNTTSSRRRLKPCAVPSVFLGHPSSVTTESETSQTPNNPKGNATVVYIPASSVTHSNVDDGEKAEVGFNHPKRTDELKLRLYIKELHAKLKRKNAEMVNVQNEYNQLKAHLATPAVACVQRIVSDATEGKGDAVMLLDQVKNYGKKCPRWSKSSLHEYNLLFQLWPNSYNYVKTTKILKLPSENSLHKYCKINKSVTEEEADVPQGVLLTSSTTIETYRGAASTMLSDVNNTPCGTSPEVDDSNVE